MRPPLKPKQIRLYPEKVAYWYLRLNGFLQIENFYVHPTARGGARTDADLLAVRFPYRAERLYDDPDNIMRDDARGLSLSDDLIDVVIAEVKSGPCALNGPWTNPGQQNIHRVLAAIGCLPNGRIDRAAEQIYETGHFEDFRNRLRIRLIAIGREENTEVRDRYPNVTQVFWSDLLGFLFDRFQTYRHQKCQTDHWDGTGKKLKSGVGRLHRDKVAFKRWALEGMSIRNDETRDGEFLI